MTLAGRAQVFAEVYQRLGGQSTMTVSLYLYT